MTSTRAVEDRVLEALTAVMDPEIPTCSIVDLGMVERIEVTGEGILVDLLPTFIGCPAKDVIGEDALRAVTTAADGASVRVRFVYDPPWTTARITERGKASLHEYGISPHWGGGPPRPVVVPLLSRSGIACPYCGSGDTAMESAFGPTPCRAAHYCRSCRNAFEGFKEK
ncbi:MAG TPA: 1,2-phenylacetyl-CoA epoxidase subunit PaaD [Actinomycetota bacterium]